MYENVGSHTHKLGSLSVSSVVKRTLSMRKLWGSIPGPVKSTQCLHRCDVSSELCCPGAKPWRGGSANRCMLRRHTASTMKIFENSKLVL